MSRPVNAQLIEQLITAINSQSLMASPTFIDETGTSVESRVASMLGNVIQEISDANNLNINRGAIIFAVNSLLPMVLFSLKEKKKITLESIDGYARVDVEDVFAMDLVQGNVKVVVIDKDRKFMISLHDNCVEGACLPTKEGGSIRFEIQYWNNGTLRSYKMYKPLLQAKNSSLNWFDGCDIKMTKEVTRIQETTIYNVKSYIVLYGENKLKTVHEEPASMVCVDNIIRNIVPPIPFLTEGEGCYLLSDETIGISFPFQHAAIQKSISRTTRKPG